MKKLNGHPNFIDLFAGCGGLSLGLEEAGFYPLMVNELNADARETYLMNRDEEFPHLRENFQSADIKEIVSDRKFFDKLFAEIKNYHGRDLRRGEVDIVAGGPPCQGFSGIGLRRSYSVEKQQLPSNHLFQDMAFFVHKVRPKIFLFENVQGLLRAKWTKNGTKGEAFSDVLNAFSSLDGYNVKFSLVHAKDYGVPQNRPRVLLVGIRKDILSASVFSNDAVKSGFLPDPIGAFPHLKDVLSDLIDPDFRHGGETKTYKKDPESTWQKKIRSRVGGVILRQGDALSEQEYSKHSVTVRNRFEAMIESGGRIPEHLRTKKFAQRLLPTEWGERGPTITACSLADDFVHYSQPRTLTVREWARLQTFPDHYQFAGKRTTGGLRRAGNPRENMFDREVPKYTQIGNAIPVELASAVGRHFASILN